MIVALSLFYFTWSLAGILLLEFLRFLKKPTSGFNYILKVFNQVHWGLIAHIFGDFDRFLPAEAEWWKSIDSDRLLIEWVAECPHPFNGSPMEDWEEASIDAHVASDSFDSHFEVLIVFTSPKVEAKGERWANIW